MTPEEMLFSRWTLWRTNTLSDSGLVQWPAPCTHGMVRFLGR